MPGLTLQTEAYVLERHPSSDTHESFGLFSREHGSLLALQRISRKPAPNRTALDLFDRVDFTLESSSQGRSWFVREARIVCRPDGIGRSYECLALASALARVVARNPVHEESRAAVAALLDGAFPAFAAGRRPDVVYLKSLYRLARDEGYPVAQDWHPGLPEHDRRLAAELINRSLDSQTASEAASARIRQSLEDYLRAHTEIRVDPPPGGSRP